jgi:hypothetical protein
MSDQADKQRDEAPEEEKDELEQQDGEELPKREMMSTVPLEPSVPPPIP